MRELGLPAWLRAGDPVEQKTGQKGRVCLNMMVRAPTGAVNDRTRDGRRRLHVPASCTRERRRLLYDSFRSGKTLPSLSDVLASNSAISALRRSTCA